MNKKILAFGAHPDDVEFGCGGLLIKEVQNGTEVKIVVCSSGESGTNGTPEGRRSEALASAELIGAEIEFIDAGGDSHMQKNTDFTIQIASMIREFKPNIVLATSLSENQHPDHRVLATTVRDACRLARYGGLAEIKQLEVHKIDSLYYYPSSAELSKAPDIIIDVSDQYKKWEESMSMHTSQMKTKNYINMVSSRARAYGASVGVEYATILWTNDPLRVDHVTDLLSSRNY